jgi:hypothetical protein
MAEISPYSFDSVVQRYKDNEAFDNDNLEWANEQVERQLTAKGEVMAMGIVTDLSRNISIELIDIDLVDANDWNPNVMEDAIFEELVRDIAEDGFLQPITVVPYAADNNTIRYRIIDGKHRFEAMKSSDMSKIPCIISKGKLAHDLDRQKFKTVRMNKIRGKLDQNKLKVLVNDLATRHPIDEIAKEFIYENVDELHELIGQARANLPTEGMKEEFDKAKEKQQIRTIEDLSNVLTQLFNMYGDTIPFHFMVFEMGGKEHLWLKLKDKSTFLKIKALAEKAKQHNVRFDQILLFALENVITDAYLKDNAEFFEGPELNE